MRGTTARVAVLGESLVDVVTRPGQPPDARPGGSPLNVAVGLARLGHDVLLVTRLGTDSYGDLVRGHLDRAGVRLAAGSVRDGASTGTATAVIGSDGSASYRLALDPSLPEPALPPDLDALHVGSVASYLEPGAAAVVAAVAAARRRGVLVSYDPNARPGLVEDQERYAAGVRGLAAAADVVKASVEDVAFLAGGPRPDWPAPLTVVTAGGAGYAARFAGNWRDYPALPAEVVDTIGAGDAFTAGLLDGLGAGGLLSRSALAAATLPEIEQALLRAAAAAALTCARRGADPPTRYELDRRLARHADPRHPL